MNKFDAIDQIYRIATLTEPTEEIRALLGGQEFNRSLELLLMLRQSPRPVRNPAGFFRRAIKEGWMPDQLPEKIDRRKENIEERFYIKRGYTPDQAHEKVVRQRGLDYWGNPIDGQA